MALAMRDSSGSRFETRSPKWLSSRCGCTLRASSGISTLDETCTSNDGCSVIDGIVASEIDARPSLSGALHPQAGSAEARRLGSAAATRARDPSTVVQRRQGEFEQCLCGRRRAAVVPDVNSLPTFDDGHGRSAPQLHVEGGGDLGRVNRDGFDRRGSGEVVGCDGPIRTGAESCIEGRVVEKTVGVELLVRFGDGADVLQAVGAEVVDLDFPVEVPEPDIFELGFETVPAIGFERFLGERDREAAAVSSEL